MWLTFFSGDHCRLTAAAGIWTNPIGVKSSATWKKKTVLSLEAVASNSPLPSIAMHVTTSLCGLNTLRITSSLCPYENKHHIKWTQYSGTTCKQLHVHYINWERKCSDARHCVFIMFCKNMFGGKETSTLSSTVYNGAVEHIISTSISILWYCSLV